MLTYNECLTIIERTLEELSYNPKSKELYEPVQYTLSLGGKRLRPCLALLSHLLFSDNVKRIIYPAAALEVFHNFTLLHDDVMDKALQRRNHDTVHVKWNENVAILSGDAMMIMAYELLTKTEPDVWKKVFEMFNQTALKVCEGQQLDMNFESLHNVTIEEYLEMIELKTAVLIAASLAIGALTAGAKFSEVETLYDLGINIGIAFQLQDDYLDVYANTEKFGKRIGGDILANKKTYLLISALNSNDESCTRELRSWLNKKDFDAQEKINAITTIYNQLNIGESTHHIINEYFTKGLQLLESLPVLSLRKSELKKLIIKTIKREIKSTLPF